MERENVCFKKGKDGRGIVKRLIITADDFGLCTEVNQAVIQAHRYGILTCASLMVSAKAAEEAIALAKEHPSLRVGLHLVLVEGYSVLSKKDIPDLVDDEKRFSNRIISTGIRYFFSKKIESQIARECEAQIKKLLDSGLKIDHLNSHDHFHIHPTILNIVIPLVMKYHIPAIRLPWQGFRFLRLSQSFTAFMMAPWVIRLRHKLQKSGIVFNHEIFGLYESGFMTEETWLKFIPKLKEGITEVYCHPATKTTAVLKETMPQYHHADELKALLNPSLKEMILRENVQTIGFGDIQ